MKKILFVVMVLGLLVVVGCAKQTEGILSGEEISTICSDQAAAIEQGLTSDEVGIICEGYDESAIQRAPGKVLKKTGINTNLKLRAQDFASKVNNDPCTKSCSDGSRCPCSLCPSGC